MACAREAETRSLRCFVRGWSALQGSVLVPGWPVGQEKPAEFSHACGIGSSSGLCQGGGD